MEAVKQNGWALDYVKEQTLEICLAAIHKNINALKYIHDPELRETIKKQTMGRSAIGNSNKIDISRKTPVKESSTDSKKIEYSNTKLL